MWASPRFKTFCYLNTLVQKEWEHEENGTYFPKLNSDRRKKMKKKKPSSIQAETFDSNFYFVVKEA